MNRDNQNILKIDNAYRRIYISHLVVYSLILFSCLAVYLTLNEFKVQHQELNRVKQVINNNMDDIVEEAYIAEVLDIPSQGNMALEKVGSLLSAQNYLFNLSITSCEGDPDYLMDLKIGTRKLGKCILISSDSRLISSSGLVSLVLILFSFVLSVLFYMFISKNLRKRIIYPMFARIEEAEKDRIYKEVSRQVAHDMQSPITALRFLFRSSKLESEEREIYNYSLERMESILGDLSRTTKIKDKLLSNTSTSSTQSFTKQLRFLVNEKAAEHHPLKINTNISNVENAKLALNSSQLLRIVSNLVNNSVEAGACDLLISLSQKSSALLIEITDNGPGFPEKMLNPKVELRESNTNTGNGLGLYSAQVLLSKVEGELILSNLDKGAKVQIIVPLQASIQNRQDLNA
jgi:signal transduction histidine kinase